MRLSIGSELFIDVSVPLLWGTRAILQDRYGRLSVLELTGGSARIEILADKPADGIEFVPSVDGFRIADDGKDLYNYNPHDRILTGLALQLPEVQITEESIRIGGNVFSGNMVIGSAVGIAVSEGGMSIGAPLPPELAKLSV